jgi:hypothetical protein
MRSPGGDSKDMLVASCSQQACVEHVLMWALHSQPFLFCVSLLGLVVTWGKYVRRILGAERARWLAEPEIASVNARWHKAS